MNTPLVDAALSSGAATPLADAIIAAVIAGGSAAFTACSVTEEQCEDAQAELAAVHSSSAPAVTQLTELKLFADDMLKRHRGGPTP